MQLEHPLCIALDLDHTLTHMVDARDSLYTMLNEYGIQMHMASEIMEATINSAEGFSEVTFTTACAKRYANIPVEKIQADMKQWLRDTLTFYSDTSDVLHAIQEKHVTAIITAGHPSWQQAKLDQMGIAADHVFIVPPTDGKAGAIGQLFERTNKKIIYIDDKPEELDRIRDAHSTDIVHTVRIMRADGPHFKKAARYTHEEINDLTELHAVVTRLSL